MTEKRNEIDDLGKLNELNQTNSTSRISQTDQAGQLGQVQRKNAEDEVTSRACALIAARAADKKKATDIMVQEVRELIGLTDYFIIVTAANNRQVEAIIDEIEEALRLQAHLKPLHREESQDATWSLLDYGTFIVHVFQPETREYYRLESLWNDAPLVDLAKEAGLCDLQYSTRIEQMIKAQK